MDRRWVVLSDEDYHSADNHSVSEDLSSSDREFEDNHVVDLPHNDQNIKNHNNKTSIAEVTEDDLEKAIEHLSSCPDINLDHLSLDPELSRCYHLVKWVDSVWAGTPNHKKLDRIIGKQFRPSEVKQSTIGSFLFGCYQITYGDIQKKCSPLCVGQVDSRSTCPQQIWIQKENTGKDRFIRVKSENSDKGFIYLNNNFKGFTQTEINLLKEAGLKKAKLFQTKRGKHFMFHPMADIEELPIINVKKNWISFIGSDTIENNHDNNFIWYTAVFFMFLIIILIIVLISQRNKSPRKS